MIYFENVSEINSNVKYTVVHRNMNLVGNVIQSSEYRFLKDSITYLLSSIPAAIFLTICKRGMGLWGQHIAKKVKHKETYYQVEIFTVSD